jgi:acetyl esterase
MNLRFPVCLWSPVSVLLGRMIRLMPLLLAATVAGAAQPAPEETPTELPGAEAHVYREGGDAAPMRLFVVKPDGWKAGDRRPGLVFFFGGGWTTGTPAKSIFWARFAAQLGMIGVAPDYRTRGRHDTPPMASVADARAAVRWLQDHAAELGLDPARIAVGGNSAGGHVALWTAITAAPPGSDERESPRLPPAALILFSTVSDTSSLTGYTPKRFGEHATALSPLHQLDPRMPPVLAFHGDADKTVPLAQAIALRDKLLAGGNVCELHIVPGGGHNFGGDVPEWREKARELMVDFLRRKGLVE